MLLTLFAITLSCVILSNADLNGTGCESIVLPSDSFSVYVICKGNFSEIDSLKLYLENISGLIKVFELQDVLLDVLPPDIFHDVPNPSVQKIIFANVSTELLEVPELGDPPLKSVKDTVESFEVHDSPRVFSWDFASLSFKNLKTFIIEDSELISIPFPFFFWRELQFVQLQNSNLIWIHPKAFQGNEKLAVCSLAHNRISSISRSMFPKPAAKLYSLDFSFNRLESFPDDMFTDMSMLHELKLDKNRLKVVSGKLLQPVWNNLTQLWLNAALKDIIAAFSLPDNVTRLNEAKSSAGNDMLMHMQLVFPLATQIQIDVIQNYGFTADREGLKQFTHAIQILKKENSEVMQMNEDLRSLLLPPLSLPYPQVSTS